MYLNQFSVVIPEGREVSGGYVEMNHNTQYTVRLRNDRNSRCDAKVEIDGKHIGTWRLNSYQSVGIERPVHDTGRFTFYRFNSEEAIRAGLQNNNDLGLVRVTFTPEIPIYRGRSSTKMSASPRGLTRGAGGTGLSGQSGQQFVDADIMNLDYSQQTVIHLRLVEVSNEPRPLTQASNSVPPPVDIY